MIIEIRKTQFFNKGAELMMYAILKKMNERYGDAHYVMAPNYKNAPYKKRAELGLYQKAFVWKYGIQWGDRAILAPKKLRDMYGIVLDKEVDVVLDAAGFAYSDQWDTDRTAELARSCRRWKRKNTKVILLPQALGPFNSAKSKKSMKIVADLADLIFTRDDISYSYLTEIAGKRKNIKKAPDFTNLIDGVIPEGFDKKNNQFCIIPNYRMIDKTSRKQSDFYFSFMVRSIKYLLEKEKYPFILINEGGKDKMLAEEIQKGVSWKVPIVIEEHPLHIKGIIGASEGVIGSRYHGLISALCQVVPTLSTGWSHKYEMLFEEYGYTEGLVDVTLSEKELYKKIDLILEQKSCNEIKKKLTEKAELHRKRTELMWKEVCELIET